MTLSDLPGRCRTCWIRLEHCICDALPRVSSRTALVLVRHAWEAHKSTGTARIASLALPALRLVTYDDDPTVADQELATLSDAFVLYPADPPAPWPARLDGPLVVLDGTWRQTRKMFKKLTSLQRLPRLSLPPKAEPVLRLREGHFDGARSTLEAITDALRLLEGDEVAAPLAALHTRYVEKVLRARGVWDLKHAAFTGRRRAGC